MNDCHKEIWFGWSEMEYNLISWVRLKSQSDFNIKDHYFSVANLQHAIAREYPIPEEKQVLLISGGESLDPVSTVGKYHAGTVSFYL